MVPGFQQLPQELIGFVQLRGQIDKHLLEDQWIVGQAFGIDRHYNNDTGKGSIRLRENVPQANVHAASVHLG